MSNDHTCLPDNIAVGTPCSPINVFIELNMHFAARRAGMILSPSDLLWFYNQVRNKGPWDFKQLGSQYSDFGNFHYGAVGKAMGIPEQVLLRVAGWAQSRAGTGQKTLPMGMIQKTSFKYATALISQKHIHNTNSPAQLNERTEILRTNSIVDTAVDWDSNDMLQISCTRGDVYFWVNRSVIDGQNIRIELDSECPKNVQDQWTYVAPGTAVGTIPEVIANDPRVQKLLRKNGKITETSSGLRILHNTERTKEVIEVQHH